MTSINKEAPILVTGANGYVASWIVKNLLEKGHLVHAAVRNPEDEKKTKHLREIANNSLGDIKLFSTDLLEKNSYKEAMQGCELIYHTASPFTIKVNNPQKELIEPAVNGTVNVLNCAKETPSVKRVVVTSSCAAIQTDAIDTVNAPNGQITEQIWNTTASLDYQPYYYSKTLAEKKAWEISKDQAQWDLITINPSFVLGPALNPKYTTSESINILKMMARGDMKMGAPKMGIGVIDVRDLAEAHYKSGFTTQAKGRYIASAVNTNFLEIGMSLLAKYGNDYALPKKAIPKWLIVLIGPLFNKLYSRKFLRNNIDIPWNADNSKIKKDLKMSFRPLQETMEDSFQALIDTQVI